MPTTYVERIFFFVLLGLIVLFMLAIFWPFLTILILSAAFATVLYPLSRWIGRRITRGVSWLASLITVLLFIVVICAPIFFIATSAYTQTQDAYNSIVSMSNKSKSFDSVTRTINEVLPDGFSFDVGAKIADLVSLLSRNVTNFFTSTLETIFLFMLMVMTIFYLLKDGHRWRKVFTQLCPLSEDNINEIFKKLQTATNQIIKGTFLIAIIQGTLVGIGFAVFGVPNAILWAVAAGIASFIPTVGTSIVCIPAILFLFSTGMTGSALGLIIWSVTLVGMIDNLLAPYIISRDTEMPSLFTLFAILGGVTLMGPAGILIGPLALSLLFALISIYRKEANI